MPPSIYVAGPVVDHGARMPELYDELRAVAERYGAEVVLPERRREVDKLAPRDFTERIAADIRHADAVVAVVRSKDRSVPVESAIAAFSGKPQVIVETEPRTVPRILAGLPGVVDVVDASDHRALQDAIRVLARRRRPPAY